MNRSELEQMTISDLEAHENVMWDLYANCKRKKAAERFHNDAKLAREVLRERKLRREEVQTFGTVLN